MTETQYNTQLESSRARTEVEKEAPEMSHKMDPSKRTQIYSDQQQGVGVPVHIKGQ